MKPFLILLLSLLSFRSGAQTLPPGMRDMRLVNNISDALESAMPWLEDRNAREKAADAIRDKNNPITQALNWTSDGGYLIRVKVLRSTLTGATVPMPPEFLGAGSVPSDIVALSSSQASISTSPDPNLVLASDRTFYVWVTQDKGGLFGWGKKKLAYGYIVSPFSEQVTTDALKKLASADMIANLRVARQGNALYGITQNLKRNVTDKAAAVRTAEQLDAYRKNLEELNRLEANLQKDLAKIEQANQTLNFINTMKGVLSMASLALQVSAAMEDIPKNEIDRARTPEDLARSVESRKQQSNTRVQEYRRNTIIIQENIQGKRTILIDELTRMGVPGPVINSGFGLE